METYNNKPVIQKKALLVGINYPETGYSLNGCWNDVELIKHLLINKYSFKPENILILRDNDVDKIPTANNVFSSFDWLLCPTCDANYDNNCWHDIKNYSGSGRQLFFSYSGHGTNFRDTDGDEKDGKDEAIVCTDYCITDDSLYKWLASLVPKKDQLVGVLDCCNSGTCLDLKTSYYPGNEDDTLVIKMNAGKHEVLGDVRMISGCRDEQTSSDAWIDTIRKYQGALTHGLTDILNKTPDISIGELCNKINHYMKENDYSQRPVVSVDGNTLPYNKFM